ncbi:hypothetical protein QTN25_001995 [Entamoeba marina]
MPTNDEIKELNNCVNSMQVTLHLRFSVLTLFFQKRNLLDSRINITFTQFKSLYVIPQSDNIDFCIHPLTSINNMLEFERYYLPTKLIINNYINNITDLTPFHFIRDISFERVYNNPKQFFKLPHSTEVVNVVNDSEIIGRIEIMNWNDLIHLQEINDQHKLHIPYPQIKKKKFTTQLNELSMLETIGFIGSVFTIIYSILSFMYLITNIIYLKHDMNDIHNASFKHYFVFYYLFFFILTLGYMVNDQFTLKYSFKYWISLLLLLWNPCIFIFYQSTIIIHLLTLFTIPLSLMKISAISFFSHLKHYELNTYLQVIFHGYWINNILEKQIVDKWFNTFQSVTTFFAAAFFISIPISSIISFFYIHSLWGYLNILPIIGSIGFVISLI